MRSATSSSLHTPFVTPSVSTNSLLIPSPIQTTPANGTALPHDPTPYPAFLKPTRTDLHSKFLHLETAQHKRQTSSLHAAAARQPDQWARCTGDEYTSRNRYGNVDPYQANRVQLDVPEGAFDYINASPILLETTKSKTALKYIATQVGCLGFVAHSIHALTLL